MKHTHGIITAYVNAILAAGDGNTITVLTAYADAIDGGETSLTHELVTAFQTVMSGVSGWRMDVRFWDMATVAYIEREIARGVADRVARS